MSEKDIDEYEEPISGSEYSDASENEEDSDSNDEDEEDSENPTYLKPDDGNLTEEKIYIDNDKRISRPRLTRYELSSLVAYWAGKIESGAKAILPTKKKNSIHIAYDDVVFSLRSDIYTEFTEEEKKQRLQLYVIRPRGKNRYEKWHITELVNFKSNLLSEEENDQSFNMMIRERNDLKNLTVY